MTSYLIKTSLRQKILLIFFGVILTFIILEITLRIVGFVYLANTGYWKKDVPKASNEYRILCLGESTTYDQWPQKVETLLNQSDSPRTFTLIDKGLGGTNSGVILSRVEENLNKFRPHMVIAMMGINDDAKTVKFHNTLKTKKRFSGKIFVSTSFFIS